MLLLACSTSMTGCVLRDFDYPEPANFPPSIESVPSGSSPLNRVLSVNLDEIVAPDGGVPAVLEFEVEVRDPDVTQPLRGRVYMDWNPLTREGFQQDLGPEQFVPDRDDPRFRRLQFTLTPRFLRRGCHLVELRVSGEFLGHPERGPLHARDIGTAAWFLRTYDTDNPVVDMELCPRPEVR